MRKYIFLYKENTDDGDCCAYDRDCCAYIETKAERFECGHYFGSVTLHGSCYSGHEFANYEDIKTVLTEEEYEQLIQFSKNIKDLGYGITKDDERYNKGIELCKAIQPIYDKLLSEENEKFFEEIIEEEKEYMMDEYNLDEEDIEQIFDEYYLDYRDRSIIGCVFDGVYDLGYEEAYSCGYIDNEIVERYFDFEKFGKDLLEEERYIQLSDGRCVILEY